MTILILKLRKCYKFQLKWKRYYIYLISEIRYNLSRKVFIVSLVSTIKYHYLFSKLFSTRKKNIYGNIFTRIYILLQKYKIKKKTSQLYK